jgi:hypothetical protein
MPSTPATKSRSPSLSTSSATRAFNTAAVKGMVTAVGNAPAPLLESRTTFPALRNATSGKPSPLRSLTATCPWRSAPSGPGYGPEKDPPP